jgi:hypothetical protein
MGGRMAHARLWIAAVQNKHRIILFHRPRFPDLIQ